MSRLTLCTLCGLCPGHIQSDDEERSGVFYNWITPFCFPLHLHVPLRGVKWPRHSAKCLLDVWVAGSFALWGKTRVYLTVCNPISDKVRLDMVNFTPRIVVRGALASAKVATNCSDPSWTERITQLFGYLDSPKIFHGCYVSRFSNPALFVHGWVDMLLCRRVFNMQLTENYGSNLTKCL